jgi:hypothetical protein
MDHIDKVLATTSEAHQFSLPIRAALVIGKNTINRYYNKTDQSEVYRIAMGMSFFSSPFGFSLYVIAQFFTRVTNSLTSKPKIGKTTGSRPLIALSARSLTVPMPQRALTMKMRWTMTMAASPL